MSVPSSLSLQPLPWSGLTWPRPALLLQPLPSSQADLVKHAPGCTLPLLKALSLWGLGESKPSSWDWGLPPHELCRLPWHHHRTDPLCWPHGPLKVPDLSLTDFAHAVPATEETGQEEASTSSRENTRPHTSQVPFAALRAHILNYVPAGLSAPTSGAFFLFIPVFPAPAIGPSTRKCSAFNPIQPMFFQSINKVLWGLDNRGGS